jgi:hypothetical protein
MQQPVKHRWPSIYQSHLSAHLKSNARLRNVSMMIFYLGELLGFLARAGTLSLPQMLSNLFGTECTNAIQAKTEDDAIFFP